MNCEQALSLMNNFEPDGAVKSAAAQPNDRNYFQTICEIDRHIFKCAECKELLSIMEIPYYIHESFLQRSEDPLEFSTDWDHQKCGEELQDYIQAEFEGTAGQEEWLEMRHHLRTCGECAQEHEAVYETLMYRALMLNRLPDAFAEVLQDAVGQGFLNAMSGLIKHQGLVDLTRLFTGGTLGPASFAPAYRYRQLSDSCAPGVSFQCEGVKLLDLLVTGHRAVITEKGKALEVVLAVNHDSYPDDVIEMIDVQLKIVSDEGTEEIIERKGKPLPDLDKRCILYTYSPLPEKTTSSHIYLCIDPAKNDD